MQKLCLTAKFPHQEIRWNYGIFWSEIYAIFFYFINESTPCCEKDVIFIIICSALRNLVRFVHFKKHEKHRWRSVSFSKVAGCRPKPATLLKLTLLHGSFSRFINCTNGTKSPNASHIRGTLVKISAAYRGPRSAFLLAMQLNLMLQNCLGSVLE